MLHRQARLRSQRANGESGFTLVELVVVIVIVGILVAIAIPLYMNYSKGANDKSADSDMRSAVDTLEQCSTDYGVYPSAIVLDSSKRFYTLTGCAGQQLNVSSGTTLTYSVSGSGYVLVGSNSIGNGANQHYCYNSIKGGQVRSVGTATTC